MNTNFILPKGFVFKGEIRRPNQDEYFIDKSGHLHAAIKHAPVDFGDAVFPIIHLIAKRKVLFFIDGEAGISNGQYWDIDTDVKLEVGIPVKMVVGNVVRHMEIIGETLYASNKSNSPPVKAFHVAHEGYLAEFFVDKKSKKNS